jgi:hypothetical protein
MRKELLCRIVTGLLLASIFGAALVACTEDDVAVVSVSTTALPPETASSVPVYDETPLPASEGYADVDVGYVRNDQLSTFQAKDPFVQQVTAVVTVPDGSTGTAWDTGMTQYPSDPFYTTTLYPPTTRYSNPTPTWPTITTKPRVTTTRSTKPPTSSTSSTSSSTTSSSTTTSTLGYVHVLKVLSVETVNSAPAVTFSVDKSVYKSRLVGDVVSTTWGQVQIVDISLTSKTVTLLHDNETITLEVGQQIDE